MSITIEDMKAELESGGYRIVSHRHGSYEFDHLRLPDGTEYAINVFGMIRIVHAHLQQQRIIEDLRALKTDIWALDENTHPDVHNAYVAKRIIEFLIKHNITEPDDISDATQDRLASVYPDESDTDG